MRMSLFEKKTVESKYGEDAAGRGGAHECEMATGSMREQERMGYVRAPVFIFCQHRTGSTLLKNMLGNCSKLAMAVDEMVIEHPWFRTVKDHIARIDLQKEKGVDAAIEILYSRKVYGGFWRYFSENEIPRGKVRKKMLEGERSFFGIIDAFLESIAEANGKERTGVKNFAHFGFLPEVMRAYPDAKCIFLVRDPLAMCASKLYSKGTLGRKRKARALAPIVHFAILAGFVFEFRRMCRAYRQYSKAHSLARVRYEDLVMDTERSLRGICDFCELPFESEMLLASGKESSHLEKECVGVDKERVSHGSKRLAAWERGIIRWVTKGAAKEMGYG